MFKCAIIGFGGLGKIHFNNIREVSERTGGVKLIAICDVDKNSFESQIETNLGSSDVNLDLSTYNLYNDAKEMLDKEELDFVITALPTYIHEKIAVMAMEKGIHVFSEKPMALTLEQCENMIKASKENNVKLMIGQCLRFSAKYLFVKNLIDNKKYGKVVKAEFRRISPYPQWSWENWMTDHEKSGGAAIDLHVHDVDFINFAFGLPNSVTSVATNHKTKYESINTFYNYDDMLVTALGDWGMPGNFPFAPGYTVRFEKATVKMTATEITVYHEDGKTEIADIPQISAYTEEMVYFVNSIKENTENTINPPESSMQTIKIALAEKESAATGKSVALK